MDLAQVALIRARYAETTAIANLELAMGITLLPEPEDDAEAAATEGDTP